MSIPLSRFLPEVRPHLKDISDEQLLIAAQDGVVDFISSSQILKARKTFNAPNDAILNAETRQHGYQIDLALGTVWEGVESLHLERKSSFYELPLEILQERQIAGQRITLWFAAPANPITDYGTGTLNTGGEFPEYAKPPHYEYAGSVNIFDPAEIFGVLIVDYTLTYQRDLIAATQAEIDSGEKIGVDEYIYNQWKEAVVNNIIKMIPVHQRKVPQRQYEAISAELTGRALAQGRNSILSIPFGVDTPLDI